MITYVLSEHALYWNIHRFDEETVTLIASGIPIEEDALEIAVRDAERNAPARVLYISTRGECRDIASFGV